MGHDQKGSSSFIWNTMMSIRNHPPIRTGHSKARGVYSHNKLGRIATRNQFEHYVMFVCMLFPVGHLQKTNCVKASVSHG